MMNNRNASNYNNHTTNSHKLNKGTCPKLKSAHNENPVTFRSNNRNSVSGNQTKINYRASQQSYSSRNSYRSAQSNANKDSVISKQFVFRMPNIIFREYPVERGVEYASCYNILDNECFVKVSESKLFCVLCGRAEPYRGVDHIDSHLNSEYHNTMFCNLRRSLLNQIPPDSSLQMNAVRELLRRWYRSQALTEDMILDRIQIIDELNEVIKSIDPECQLRLLGSLLVGNSLKSSDINLELIHRNSALFDGDHHSRDSLHHKLNDPDAEYGHQINYHTLHYDLIPNAANTLYKVWTTIKYYNPQAIPFEVVSGLSDLNARIPKVVLRHKLTHQILEVSCYAKLNHKLASLLNTYLSLDERARIISILIKYWAKICKIDNPNVGTFPPDTFVILVIYYLQRTSPPVLPCLHELISKNSKPDAANDVSNLTNKYKDLDIDDNHRDKTSATTGRKFLFDSKEDSAENEVEVEAEAEVEAEGDEDELDAEEDDYINYNEVYYDTVRNLKWNSSNVNDYHILFINFFKFMMDELNQPDVITIRTLKKVSIHSKGWKTQLKAIENPVRPKVNISRYVGLQRTYSYIKSCFKYAFYYLTSIPLDSHFKQKVAQDLEDYIDLYYNKDRLDFYISVKKDLIKFKEDNGLIKEMIIQNLFARDVDVINGLFDKVGTSKDNLKSLLGTVANHYNESLLKPRDTAATLYCLLCKRQGHPKDNCPKRNIETLTDEHINDSNRMQNVNFDRYFLKIYRLDSITPKLAALHLGVVNELTSLINKSTGLDCVLRLFGSTVNNLGSYDSDLDICMTLKNNRTGRGVNCVEILQKVYDLLIKVEKVDSLESILSARVPIIKFRYLGYDVDISMYNECAIYNSKLLKRYSEIDERLPQLFYLVKRYAKACGVADASKGSLSSYAWSLMVIHYLQHTNPPILPVLQDFNLSTQRRQFFGICGWNVWFDPDISIRQQNHQNLTHLFKGFFKYFAEFNFEVNIVSIRKFELITKFQKNWFNCMMAIEDPFVLTHNLSSRLDQSMAIYILNSFAQAFKHIVSVQLDYSKSQVSFDPIKRLFNGKSITQGAIPPTRGCRICGKIGHKIKDCPRKGVQRFRPRN